MPPQVSASQYGKLGWPDAAHTQDPRCLYSAGHRTEFLSLSRSVSWSLTCFYSSFSRQYPFHFKISLSYNYSFNGGPQHCRRHRVPSRILMDPQWSSKLAKYVLPQRNRRLSLLCCQWYRTDEWAPLDTWWILSLEIHFGQASSVSYLVCPRLCYFVPRINRSI